MKKSILNFSIVILILSINTSCLKKRKYNDGYQGDRDYTLLFDHIDVVDETETDSINGKLNVEEKATLNIYLKNEGPDPCLLSYGFISVESSPESNGFYITNVNIDDVIVGPPDAEGKKVQYIDPGATDYIAVPVRTYDYLDYNQDVLLYFDLIDYDGDTTHLNFPIHIE